MAAKIRLEAQCEEGTQIEVYFGAEALAENNPVTLQDGEHWTQELSEQEDRQVTIREVKK